MATSSTIPTVDLSSFTTGDDEGKQKVKDIISRACTDHGFFQIVNHGVPLDLMNRAMAFSKTFFDYSEEEKLKVSSGPSAPVPAGYCKQQQERSTDNDDQYLCTFPPEYFLMFPPGSDFNVFPNKPPDFKETLEELFSYFTKTCELLQTILADCLGLPTNFFKEFNDDRSWDLMSTFHYFQPADQTMNKIALSEHQDVNCITLVLQDEVGGLELLKNGEWIPVPPIQGTLVVNLGDVFQVLSNNKYKSNTHRVIRKGRSRYSYTFFHSIQGDKWIEPLPAFCTEVGEPPKYRGFLYKEYLALRSANKTATKPEDIINITHYSITT